MKKVIKPSKQPTKKQSQRSQRSQRSVRSQRNTNTAKLKKAIGKIAAQLVKDHPKLVKGGGSSGITDLIFSKNLMKGGEINDELRGDIVKFLKDSAPKVNKLKKDLLIKLIEYILDIDKSARGGDLELQMNSLNVEFKKGVYAYQLNIEEPYIKKLKDNNKKEIYDDFLILDIVGRFFTLSRIDETIPKEISNVKFKELSVELLNALSEYDQGKSEEKKNEIQALLEEYKKDGTVVEKIDEVVNNPDNDAKYAQLVANAEEVYEKNRDIVERIQKSNEISLVDDNIIAKDGIVFDEDKTNNLNDFNTLYTELKDKEKGIKAAMDKFNENTPPDDVMDEVIKLIDEFNNSYRNIYTLNKIFNLLKDNQIEGTPGTPGRAALTLRNTSTEAMNPNGDILAIQEPAPEEKKRNVAEMVRIFDGNDEKKTGGNPTKYKSTGQVVNIMYKKRKYKRTIFVKEKRKTKYCKINNEYILLSKLNVL